MPTMVLAAVILAIPPTVGCLGAAVLVMHVRFNLSSALAHLGVLALAMAYVVPFTLVASAIGLAGSLWLSFTVRESGAFEMGMKLFLIPVALSCLFVLLLMAMGGEGR